MHLPLTVAGLSCPRLFPVVTSMSIMCTLGILILSAPQRDKHHSDERDSLECSTARIRSDVSFGTLGGNIVSTVFTELIRAIPSTQVISYQQRDCWSMSLKQGTKPSCTQPVKRKPRVRTSCAFSNRFGSTWERANMPALLETLSPTPHRTIIWTWGEQHVRW